MPTQAGPITIGEEHLVFGYDLTDIVNSYVGEPTTNTMRQSNNVTGTQYGYNNEYDTCQLVKTWNASLKTPVGIGATLLTERNIGNSPWYGLNWFDDSEDGKRCMSAYIYPVNSVTQLRIGMVGDSSNSVFFNLDTRAITYGAGISNTNAFIQDVPGYPGWLRIGANIEGRGGGWVAFLGTGFDTYYTPQSPFQSFYVCGIQYERNIASHCTQFTPAETTRSATQGLLPLTSNTSINLSSVSFDSNAQIVFDGTDDTISISSYSAMELVDNVSIEYVYMRLSTDSILDVIANKYHNTGWELFCTTSNTFALAGRNGDGTYYSTSNAAYTIQSNKYYHLVAIKEGLSWRLYVNGELYASLTANSIGTWSNTGILQIGGEGSGYFPNMKLPVLKIYNRVLKESEISRNFKKF
jgi:hypothetical protein